MSRTTTTTTTTTTAEKLELPTIAELKDADRALQGGVAAVLHVGGMIRAACKAMGAADDPLEITLDPPPDYEAIGRYFTWFKAANAQLAEISSALGGLDDEIDYLVVAVDERERGGGRPAGALPERVLERRLDELEHSLAATRTVLDHMDDLTAQIKSRLARGLGLTLEQLEAELAKGDEDATSA